MLDGRMSEDACTTSSPYVSKGTGEQNSFIFGISLKNTFKLI